MNRRHGQVKALELSGLVGKRGAHPGRQNPFVCPPCTPSLPTTLPLPHLCDLFPQAWFVLPVGWWVLEREV